MTFDGRSLISLIMFALFATACVLAIGLPTKAAFMPLLIGIPGAILCGVQLAIDLFRPRIAPTVLIEETEGGRSETEVFAWLAAFMVVLLSLGFVVGGPLLVGAFIRISSRESWRAALFAAAGTFLVLWGVFIWLLGLSLFEGLILGPLLG
ncbi:tripartite tricarboxylate transporter TctB family protein [Puniceibacterium sp. IMCC21224]|uniref:tripartite tricarboxylate transporter TctB family protein n=1 Tax=Puniceibacterium sp. IMCC21224 TaxID=1618204 RepID=UPI00064DD9F6|nr:tripartite tricarboxylate transporter TctB family protein [Puniceibacterium sp. IMCC21224]KMK65002.1 Tripartite tricarboxylate transporter TctB family [Puniceibacterium sp. IMCC21224]